jgi:hypothetical protein
MITAELRLRQEGPLRDPSKRLSEGALARSGRAHAVADAICFASAAANLLVLIGGGAAKVSSKPVLSFRGAARPKDDQRTRRSTPLSALGEFPNDPNYFWPDDRAWCLCTDTDFDWAYLAGSTGCIEEVLTVPVLDAYATTPENPARAGMDVVNDPHGTVARRW